MMKVPEHEHSLELIDLQPNYPHYEEKHDDEDYEGTINRDLYYRCGRCFEEINWFHMYYYKCTNSCEYFLHKFCAELPATLKHTSHDAHALILFKSERILWSCDICSQWFEGISYMCFTCNFSIDLICATTVKKKRFYHPSHSHPLVLSSKSMLCMCDACRKEHKGRFYLCTTCLAFFIHTDCVFLPKKLLIQQFTNNDFFHTHPLTLTYSFLNKAQRAKFDPTCRVCDSYFEDENIWNYKCEKCRYYTHLDCATSRGEPFMSIFLSARMGKTIKNFEDIDHPNLLNLPFPDQTSSILKHLFYKENGYGSFEIDKGNLKHAKHQHPLILVQTQSKDIVKPTSSRINSLLCHNPMKKIELLCNGCMRPIMTVPFYKCNNEDESCNFVLHEWCTQLPSKVKNDAGHPEHALILLPVVPHKFFGVFTCNVCGLPCNGFAYCCLQCDYQIDVNCGFIPEKITHAAHPNHLLWRVKARSSKRYCVACFYFFYQNEVSFSCRTCDFDLHPWCSLLLPETIKHKYDKHPMDLSYFPIENHKSEYFCELCEEGLDPQCWFYHCKECVQSMHSACAPLILASETAASSYYDRSIYKFVNIKFGGIINIEDHPHKDSLSFVQGIESDGTCTKCDTKLQYQMIFKCSRCKFAIHWECCKHLSNL